MNLRDFTKAQIAGGLFLIVGLMQLITAGYVLALVWGLLGVSMLVRTPAPGGERSLGRVGRTPRGCVGTAGARLGCLRVAVSLAWVARGAGMGGGGRPARITWVPVVGAVMLARGGVPPLGGTLLAGGTWLLLGVSLL